MLYVMRKSIGLVYRHYRKWIPIDERAYSCICNLEKFLSNLYENIRTAAVMTTQRRKSCYSCNIYDKLYSENGMRVAQPCRSSNLAVEHIRSKHSNDYRSAALTRRFK